MSDRLKDARSTAEREQQRERIAKRAEAGETFDAGIVHDLLRDIAFMDGMYASLRAAFSDDEAQITDLIVAINAADARCREAQERAEHCEAAMQGAISLMEKAPDADNTFSAWLNLRAAIGVLNAALTLPKGHPPPDAGGAKEDGVSERTFDLRGVTAVKEANDHIEGLWKESYDYACESARESVAFHRQADPTQEQVERHARQIFQRKVVHLLSRVYDDALIERLAEKAHDGWMENQRAKGIVSRPSVEDGEEFMVPYDALSEKAKEIDRSVVRSVVLDIRAIMREPVL